MHVQHTSQAIHLIHNGLRLPLPTFLGLPAKEKFARQAKFIFPKEFGMKVTPIVQGTK